MKLKTNILCGLLFAISTYSFGQQEQYNYKREVQNITDQWHKLDLPIGIYEKVSPDLRDIRIFGITKNNDTVEAPYFIKLAREKVTSKQVSFKLINEARSAKGYFFTFEVPIDESINRMKLDFKQTNFDWRLALEGSQDQREWFTILEDYRIVSIKNELTDYRFTKVSFPDSKYRYFRLRLDSKVKPDLVSAGITFNDITEAGYNPYQIQNIKTDQDRNTKKTIIELDLATTVPISYLKINVRDTFDYYRPISIQYLADSTKTEKGWLYNYRTLKSAILGSLEENEFKFNSTILKKLKVVINNHDNPPLTVDSIYAKGYVHELVARFTEPATYHLTYGNPNARQARYDIGLFTKNIPETIPTLTLGDEQPIDKITAAAVEPLFKNKTWLWAVMVVIILLLGWFSLKMMKKG